MCDKRLNFVCNAEICKTISPKKKCPSKQPHFSGEILVVCKTKKGRMFLCKRCVFANPLQESKNCKKRKYFFQALKYYTEYKKYTFGHQLLKNNMKAETLSMHFGTFKFALA